MTYSWINKYLNLKKDNIISKEDLLPLNDDYQMEKIFKDFLKIYKVQKLQKNTNNFTMKIFAKLYKKELITMLCISIMSSMTTIITPYIIKVYIDWYSGPDQSLANGIGYAILVGSVLCLRLIFFVKEFELFNDLCPKISSLMYSVIRWKALRLSTGAKKIINSGLIQSYLLTFPQRSFLAIYEIRNAVLIFITVIGTPIYLCIILGKKGCWFLVGLVVVFLSLGIPTKLFMDNFKDRTKLQTERISKINELVKQIKVILFIFIFVKTKCQKNLNPKIKNKLGLEIKCLGRYILF